MGLLEQNRKRPRHISTLLSLIWTGLDGLGEEPRPGASRKPAGKHVERVLGSPSFRDFQAVDPVKLRIFEDKFLITSRAFSE